MLIYDFELANKKNFPFRVHWIPPECHHNFSLAKTLPVADVWAFGTTLWEIFSYGSIPDASCDADVSKKLRLALFIHSIQNFYLIIYFF